MKTKYIVQLSKEIQEDILNELKQLGLSQDDIENAMSSRLSDLSDTININKYLNTNIETVCKYLQRNDRNGDYIEMYQDYINQEIPLEVILEVCNRVLTEWKEDLQTIESPTKDDLKDIEILQSYIELLN